MQTVDTGLIRKHTYDEIKKEFDKSNAWGLSCNIDMQECNPDFIRSEDHIKDYVIKLCDLIDMKRFQSTLVVGFGDDEKVAGYSMVQLIETSLISGHFANKTNRAYIDVFSCKLYNPYEAAEFTKQFFKASKGTLQVSYRL